MGEGIILKFIYRADLPARPAGLLGHFAPSGFALCTRILLASLAHISRFALTKIFKKKSLSQSIQNVLKRIEMLKKCIPLTHYAPRGVAQSPSGKAQLSLLHVTPRVPRSVHAKFHVDWTKTVGAREIHTNRQTDKQIVLF